MGFLFSALSATLCLLPVATSHFLEPRSDVPDLNQTYYIGDTVRFSWAKGWSWGTQSQPESVDLYIKWWDDGFEFPYWKVLKENISLDNPGEVIWKVDIRDEILASSTQYHLRFLPHTDPPVYQKTGPRLPSKAFNIYQRPDGQLPSSVLTVSSSTVAAVSASTTPSPSNDAVPVGTENASSTTNNIGIIAGAVVGGLAALAILCGFALLLLKRVKQRKKTQETSAGTSEKGPWTDGSKPEGFVSVVTWTGATVELAGSNDRPTMELDTTQPKYLSGKYAELR